MNLVFRYKKSYLLVLTLVMLAMTAVPVQAADNVGKQVEVRVKVGSSQMSASGEKIKIQPPYSSGKVTMVPISVFTDMKSFGATLKPSGKNHKLIYLKHSLTLTKGSKTATFDGKKTTLPVAPVDKSGVMMVPLESIAKALGIKTSTDAKTKELVIKGPSGIASFGDSYFKWSINLPADITHNEPFNEGAAITFVGANKEYYLGIFVNEAEVALSVDAQSGILEDYAYSINETLIDKGTITVGKDKYQRLITTDEDGYFFEYRGIQRNGYFYTVLFGLDATSKTELNAYKPLLDSFRPSFDMKDKSLKDISIYKDGIIFTNEKYGLQVEFPAGWDEEKSNKELSFSGPNGAGLTFEVFSILPGDTVDAWIEREMKQLGQLTVQDYWKKLETTSVTWNGVPAKIVKLAITNDKKTWFEITRLFAIKGEYKYDVHLTYKQEDKPQVAGIIDGMKVDFSTSKKNFGQVPDKADTTDLNVVTTKQSKTYDYSVTVPEHWMDGDVDMESGEVEFGSDSGIFYNVNVMDGYGYNPDGVSKSLETSLTKDGTMKLDSQTKVKFAEVNAVKQQYSTTAKAASSMKVEVYVFYYIGNIYIVQTGLAGIAETPLNVQQMKDALNSFTLN